MGRRRQTNLSARPSKSLKIKRWKIPSWSPFYRPSKQSHRFYTIQYYLILASFLTFWHSEVPVCNSYRNIIFCLVFASKNNNGSVFNVKNTTLSLAVHFLLVRNALFNIDNEENTELVFSYRLWTIPGTLFHLEVIFFSVVREWFLCWLFYTTFQNWKITHDPFHF